MGKQERLQSAVEYLKFKNQKKLLKDFADFANIDRSTLSSAMNGNEAYLTDSFLYKFVARFPEIDLGWLLTGEGAMTRGISLSQSGAGNTINQSGSPAASASIGAGSDMSRALDEINRLTSALTADLNTKDGQISRIQEQIDRLLGIIETMNKNRITQ